MDYYQLTYSNMDHDALEKKYVHDIYDTIAHDFSRTRWNVWGEVKLFLNSLESYSLIADIGCGNGKNFLEKDNKFYVGFDITHKFLEEIVTKTKYEGVCGNALALPFKQNSFDAVINIAVLHHLSSHERRLQVLSELIRITKIRGLILITVWALEQSVGERQKFTKQENYVKWSLRGSDEVFLRYYYVFKEGELEDLISHFDNVVIKKSHYEMGNWGVVIEKIK
jgi:SAM-dependent methyltransferase